MAIDKLRSVTDPSLEKILMDIYTQAVGIQYLTTAPTTVPEGKIVIYDDGAGTKGICLRTGQGNIITLAG